MDDPQNPILKMGKINRILLVVYDLKSVGALEMKFVAPISEQIATTTMHFLKVPGELC